MGKWTDKNYVTHSEWTRDFGGLEERKKEVFRRLPFNYCSLSLQPIEGGQSEEGGGGIAVSNSDGSLFNLVHLIPFLHKYGVDPVTGKKANTKAFFRVHFHRNADGDYHCPATLKVFNENTYIVVIKATGNVFAKDAIDRLNIKANNWRDLITDEPFTRADIITIQDPMNLGDKYNFATFHHVKNNLRVNKEEEELLRSDPKYFINLNDATKRVLSRLEDKKEVKQSVEEGGSSTKNPNEPTGSKSQAAIENQEKIDKERKRLEAHYSTGKVMASFTSTSLSVVTKHEAAIRDANEVMYEQVARMGKKGYARIITNMGDLNFELHCELTPRTCHNFFLLAKKGFYKNVIFHRNIKNFMIQGGDPTGSGKGGESAWGKPFKDEFRQNLTHTGAGILSMANSGPNTNTSQFFITYKSCRHLDNVHTVFGRLVGGLEVLKEMEKVPTDQKERPTQPITIKDVAVFVDPFEDYENSFKEAEEKEREREKRQKEDEKGTWFSNPVSTKPKASSKGVGKYLPAQQQQSSADDLASKRMSEDAFADTQATKKTKLSSDLSDFSSW